MHYSKLQIWQKAMMLSKMVYQAVAIFPKEELYGLTSQIKRSAVSVPSNIAEGSQRGSNKDFAHFVLIAKGSLAELETQLLLAKELGYMDLKTLKQIKDLSEELHKMIHSFHSKLMTQDS